MTGATMLVVSDGGTNYCLGKVRHSGYQVEGWVIITEVLKLAPADVWPEYLKFRRQGQSQVSADGEIVSAFGETGFSRPLPAGLSYEEALAELERQLVQYHPKDGYCCGYMDYFVVVDFDKKQVFVNEELI